MSRPTKITPNAIGRKVELGTYTLNHKDFILYALGIGFSTDPLNTNDFKYTYELDKRFSTFPTIASCFGQQLSLTQFLKNTELPKFPLHAVLHGEERLHMVHPSIKVNGKYHVQMQTIDVIDRGEGKGAFLVDRLSGYLLNEKGQKDLAFYLDRNTFVRTLGGSGLKSTGKLVPIPPNPKRNPDLIIKDKTFPNQAILYRLNSDPNPLHIDPQNAKVAGFPRPIIHGLATYGTVVRSIVQNILQNDGQKVKSVEVRFTGHVFPGESLEIKVWKEAAKLFFQAQTVERKTKVVSGVIGLRESAKL